MSECVKEGSLAQVPDPEDEIRPASWIPGGQLGLRHGLGGDLVRSLVPAPELQAGARSTQGASGGYLLSTCNYKVLMHCLGAESLLLHNSDPL